MNGSHNKTIFPQILQMNSLESSLEEILFNLPSYTDLISHYIWLEKSCTATAPAILNQIFKVKPLVKKSLKKWPESLERPEWTELDMQRYRGKELYKLLYSSRRIEEKQHQPSCNYIGIYTYLVLLTIRDYTLWKDNQKCLVPIRKMSECLRTLSRLLVLNEACCVLKRSLGFSQTSFGIKVDWKLGWCLSILIWSNFYSWEKYLKLN